MTSTTGKNQAFYLYCVAPSERLRTIEGTGVDERSPLFVHCRGGLAAVLSEVSLDDFTGPEAEARMQDVSWIGPRALHHEEVIEQVSRSAPVFPARFGTLFSSLENLDRLLETHRRTLAGFLEFVSDKEEWAVKIYLDRVRAREELVAAALKREEASLSHSPGARYLQEKRIRTESDTRLRSWLKETGQELWDGLSKEAAQAVERKVLPSGATDAEGEMVFNWAFLVSESRLSAFHAAVEAMSAKLAPQGLTLHSSGPWPPYSFTPPLDREPAA